MKKTHTLKNDWKLYEQALNAPLSSYLPEKLRIAGAKSVTLPFDVHQAYLQDKQIKDPSVGVNSFDADWMEHKSWLLIHRFNWEQTPHFDVNARDYNAGKIELCLDYIDSAAEIFLNGSYLGQHLSTHYPFVCDIREYLVIGENTLLIRLSHGAEKISQEQVGEFEFCVSTEAKNGRQERGDVRRAFIRKPQYVFGWDWGPRYVTCGLGKAEIIQQGLLALKDCFIDTLDLSENDEQAEVSINLEIENSRKIETLEASLELNIKDPRGQTVFEGKEELYLRSGFNKYNKKLTLNKPMLWWPRELGESHLYTLEAQLSLMNATEQQVDSLNKNFGVRTISMDTSKIPDKKNERLFALCVNNKRIFCKGSNWIPSDILWQGIEDSRYEQLIDAAVDSNFNMLRIWGGAIYEKEVFYRLCDEKGIMVWQDFMFGCSMVPDREENLRDLVEKELRYQLKRLRNHPSVVLWCGNNENHSAWHDDWYEGKTPYFGGEIIYNQMAPELVENLDPNTPYWNSSPYGGKRASDEREGDCHFWGEAMLNDDIDTRCDPSVFENYDHKFYSEWGYLGPTIEKSVQKYLELDDNTFANLLKHPNMIQAFADNPLAFERWQHHTNTFEAKTVIAGMNKFYALGNTFSFKEYLLHAGLVQGHMLYSSISSFRSKRDCYGALFWMFADVWGEIGWTTLDYYLEKKIAYYFVKRAFKNLLVFVKGSEREKKIVIANDLKEEKKLNLSWGFVSQNREKLSVIEEKELHVNALSKTEIKTQLNESETLGKLFYAQISDGESIVETRIDWPLPIKGEWLNARSLNLDLKAEDSSEGKNKYALEIMSSTLVHGLHYSGDSEIDFEDAYFDMLPGEYKIIELTSHQSENELMADLKENLFYLEVKNDGLA